jgi:copper chaperone CopZ
METASREMSIEIAVPSCGCCSAKIEEEVGDALRLPRGSLKFVVPVTAQLLYDPQVVELREIVESLKRRGCKIPVERLQYGIPLRPLFLPGVWKARIERLGKELDGVVLASIDFVTSAIAVDYVPTLIGPHEILSALLGHGRHRSVSKKPGMKGGLVHDPGKDNFDCETVRNDNGGPQWSRGTGRFWRCHDRGRESGAAQLGADPSAC